MDEYEQKATPYGGRGLFATKGLSSGTVILTCNEPYAWVIYKKFRKEVCAECFLYVRDDIVAQKARRLAWKIRPSNSSGAIGEGVWFCSEKCRDEWGTVGCYSSEAVAIQRAIDRLHASMLGKQGKRDQAKEAIPNPTPITNNEVDDLDKTIDARWKTAESSLMKNVLRSQSLSESELETARFLSSAIIRCWREELDTLGKTTQNALQAPKLLSKWENLLTLQNNEAVHLRAHPDSLDTWIRVYTFLRCAVQAASSAIPSTLASYFEGSERIRDVLARDHGNVFGIWEEGEAMLDDDESEMLGFAMYIEGSYFNHSCDPNVGKTRRGRAMEFRTTREIVAGEELNINYIDTKADWKSRRKELLSGWYFDCKCRRCIDEQASDITT
ncbi:Histone-lysine N-methyltransferase set-6 [Pleurotus ostreatus]|nr:Histone-lysine N-methyltransferase set-6 [Pleurotus ostreatus]